MHFKIKNNVLNPQIYYKRQNKNNDNGILKDFFYLNHIIRVTETLMSFLLKHISEFMRMKKYQ